MQISSTLTYNCATVCLWTTENNNSNRLTWMQQSQTQRQLITV